MAGELERPVWWRRIFHRPDLRTEGARDAITALAMKFDSTAETYRHKCKDNRAEFYASMARELRNNREWAIVRASRAEAQP